MHAGLVNEDHTFALLVGVLFGTQCGWNVHPEPACFRVCETNNLESLPLYGGVCSCRRLVREYDRLSSLGVMNASGRHRSCCSDMVVET